MQPSLPAPRGSQILSVTLAMGTTANYTRGRRASHLKRRAESLEFTLRSKAHYLITDRTYLSGILKGNRGLNFSV